MTAPEQKERIRAARVGARVELVDLRVRKLAAELHQPTSEGPLSFALDVKPAVSRVDELVVYSLEYEFSSQDNDQKTVVDGTIEISVLYQLEEGAELTEGELAAFGNVSVLFTAHPYLRELLHSLTLRMGLPPLILDVMRSPLDAELEGSQ
jgi:preprotein translocase subunit SecB